MGRETRSDHWRARAGNTTAREERPPTTDLLPFASGTFSRPSDATQLSSATSLETVGSNVLRRENRGDGNGPVALFEGARTNLFDNRRPNSWSNKNAVVINALAGTSLLDGRAQDTVDFGQVPPNHQMWDNTGRTLTAAVYAHSFWWKVLSGVSTDQRWIGQLASAVGRIQKLDAPSDWQYESTVDTYLGTETIGSVARNGVIETKTIIWDAHQLELGPFPSSYIDVNGASASRSGDNLSFSAYSDVIRLGRWRMRWDPIYAHSEANATHTLLDFDSAVTENNLYFDQATNSIRVRVGGVQVLSQAITFGRYPWIELAFDWDARELTITGALTGDGTYAITGVANWPANTLYWAQRHDASSPDFARISEPEVW